MDVNDRHRLIDAAASLNKELDNDWAVAKMLPQGNGIEAKRDQIDHPSEEILRNWTGQERALFSGRSGSIGYSPR